MEKHFGWWLPLDVSTHGSSIDLLINVLHLFMIVLFLGWGIYLVYCLIKFRARPGHKPHTNNKHFKLPTYLEIGIAIFEVILLIFIASPIWFRYRTHLPDPKNALEVKIVAEQFAWNIHYPGKDGKFGKTKLELIDGTNVVGLDRDNDPDAKDDIVTINNFHIPVNKPVLIHLSSKDVIHSFFLPVARVKQDAIPGMTVPVWFEAKKTGEFEIACAQLCGIGHYRMKGSFFVDTEEGFKKFIAEEEALLNPATTQKESEANPATRTAAIEGSHP